VVLQQLRFAGDEKQMRDAGIRFQFVKNIVNPPLNKYIKVQSCKIEGGVKDRYSIPDPASNDNTVEIEQ
jgi:hypothetical protein